MSVENNNLLLSLVKWASRQEENFTTEAFVHLLRHLQKHEPEIVRDLLKEKMGVDLAKPVNLAKQIGVKDFIFNTQATQPSEIRPDIEIAAPGYLIFIEVKVSAGLRDGQLKSYQQALKNSGIPNTKLILLSRIQYTNLDSGIGAIRWQEIAKWLDSKSGTDIHDTSTYFIKQFVEFLQGPPAPPPPPPSWRKMLTDEFGELQEMLLIRDKIDNVEKLVDYPILYGLLTMMGEVVDAQSQPVLVHGSFNGEYIGYDFQDRRYCFYIYFYGKECKLVFMTWNCKIDVNQAKETFGQVVGNAGPVRWQNTLKINGPEDQVQIKEFYQKSYEFAQTIIVPT